MFRKGSLNSSKMTPHHHHLASRGESHLSEIAQETKQDELESSERLIRIYMKSKDYQVTEKIQASQKRLSGDLESI